MENSAAPDLRLRCLSIRYTVNGKFCKSVIVHLRGKYVLHSPHRFVLFVGLVVCETVRIFDAFSG